jgi:hypothetical protein
MVRWSWLAMVACVFWSGTALAQEVPKPQPPNEPAEVDVLPGLLSSSGMRSQDTKDKPAEEGAPAPVEFPAVSEKKGFHLEASWDNGFRLYSVDENFKVHVGGNAQVDTVWLIGPKSVFAIPGGGANGVENASAVDIRRARFRMDGSIYDQFDYMVEYDFANANNENEGLEPASFGNLSNSPIPCNVWMQIRDLPWLGNVRIGN